MIFARLRGRIDWACPVCNYLQHTKVTVFTDTIQCIRCTNKFKNGIVFYKVKSGASMRVPRDTLMIAGGFTTRREVNRCYCENCGKEISDKVAQSNKDHEMKTENKWWEKDYHSVKVPEDSD